jgi:hypothetical protein
MDVKLDNEFKRGLTPAPEAAAGDYIACVLPLKVLKVDERRQFAYVCDEGSDKVYIAHLLLAGVNDRENPTMHLQRWHLSDTTCSCSRFLAAPPSQQSALAWSERVKEAGEDVEESEEQRIQREMDWGHRI